MITVTMQRDEARSMQQYFFFYLEELCKMKERQESDLKDKMFQHVIRDTFEQVQKMFYKKLLNKGNKLKFEFTDSQAIILYSLLFNFPIDAKNNYLVLLRQLLINILYDPIITAITKDDIKSRQPVETG